MLRRALFRSSENFLASQKPHVFLLFFPHLDDALPRYTTYSLCQSLPPIPNLQLLSLRPMFTELSTPQVNNIHLGQLGERNYYNGIHFIACT